MLLIYSASPAFKLLFDSVHAELKSVGFQVCLEDLGDEGSFVETLVLCGKEKFLGGCRARTSFGGCVRPK